MKKALEDFKYEAIKAHILDPENSPLPKADQDLMNRVLSMAKLLDRQPIQKNAVALHMAKYKDIGRSQAYEDCKFAMRLFNTIYTFEYEFWQTWLLNDIVRNIDRWRKSTESAAGRVIALEHSNLIKALGEKPVKDMDPKLVQEHTFLIPIQINNVTYTFDLQKFLDLPDGIRKKVSDALVTDIKESDAEEIMKS
jgi:hypothetical protein